jgi:hypothetical protein
MHQTIAVSWLSIIVVFCQVMEMQNSGYVCSATIKAAVRISNLIVNLTDNYFPFFNFLIFEFFAILAPTSFVISMDAFVLAGYLSGKYVCCWE